MPLRTEKNIWTYLIVTAVTAVIWFLAASETRDSVRVNALLHLKVAESETPWIIAPETRTVQLTVHGSRPALDRAREAARRGITIELPPVRGREFINVVEHLRRNAAIVETGVTVASVDDSLIEVERDEIVSVAARVRASLPGVQTEGEVTIEPPEVAVYMPSTLRERGLGELTVEAFLDRAQLERLAPDVRHEPEAKVRLSEALTTLAAQTGGTQHIAIAPSAVRLGFTIRSRTSQTTLGLVRVHLSGPPEDNKEYIVELEDEDVRNVTLTGDADLIRRIKDDPNVRVFAVLSVSSQEKEQRITSKRISHFIAYVPDGEGGTRAVQVEGRVGDSPTLPEIRLSIIRKESP